MRKYCVVETIYIDGTGAKIQYGKDCFDIPPDMIPELAVEGSVLEIEIKINTSKTVAKCKNATIAETR